eukprot:12938285-Prorocentrum_lima.AAC.1
MRHSNSQTLCFDRSKSMDKVNTEFQALVLDEDLKVATKPELDVVLGCMTSFTDLRKAKATKSSAKI